MPSVDVDTLLAEAKAATKAYDYATALALSERCVAELRQEPPCYQLVEALVGQADALRSLARYPEADVLFAEALPLAERVLGEGDGLTRFVMNCWAVLHKYQGRFDEGAALYERSLRLAMEAGGEDTHEVATLCHNIAGLEHARKQYAAAEPYARRSVDIRKRLRTPDDAAVLADEAALASILMGLGQYKEAEQINRRALDIFVREHGEVHYEVAVTCNNLATIMQSTKRPAKALRFYQRALAIKEQVQGPDHVDVAITLNNLALLHQSQGRKPLAAPLYERALQIFEAKLPPEHPSIEICRENLEGLTAKPTDAMKPAPMPFARSFWELWNFAMADATDANAIPMLQSFVGIGQHLLEGRHGCPKCARHWKTLREETVWQRIKTADDARLWLWHAHNLTREGAERMPYASVATQFAWPAIPEDEALKRAASFWE